MSRVRAELDTSDHASPLYYPKNATALLLLDYQNMIVAMAGPKIQQTIEATAKVGKWAYDQKIPVLHCMIDVNKTCPPHFRAAKRLEKLQGMVRAKPEIGKEHPALAELGASESDHHWFLRTPGVVSATHSPGLVESLKERGIRSLILCGISTSGCVLSTTRAAADAGFVVTVVEDCCADPVEGLHDTLIEHVLPMQAHVVTSKKLKEAFDGDAVRE